MAARIAIINHDPVFLKLVENILVAEGFDTIICATGTTAYETVRKELPDLVILDTWLDHRESGWILLQTLLLDDSTRDIPMIMATTEVGEFEERAASREDLHSIQLLRKPFIPDQLLSAVRTALGGPNGTGPLTPA